MWALTCRAAPGPSQVAMALLFWRGVRKVFLPRTPMVTFPSVSQGSIPDSSVCQQSVECWPASTLRGHACLAPSLSCWEFEKFICYVYLFSNHFCYAYYVLSLILSTLHIVTHLILLTTLWGRCNYHLLYEDTEHREDNPPGISWSKWQSWDFNPGRVYHEQLYYEGEAMWQEYKLGGQRNVNLDAS